MIDAQRHRGPDGDGVWAEGAVGLGHRRLAIIDLSSAGVAADAQGPRGDILIYNGEVYNFRELRRELEALGHQFVSASDTEVVLHAWTEWGEDSLLPPERTLCVCRVESGARRRSRARPGSVWHQAAVLPRRRLVPRVCVGGQGPARPSRGAATALPAGAERVLHVSEHLHRPNAVRRHPAAAGGLRHGTSRRSGHPRGSQRRFCDLLPSADPLDIERGRSRVGSPSPVRRGGQSSACQRRAGGQLFERRDRLGIDHDHRAREHRAADDLHWRVRSFVGVRPRARRSTSERPRSCSRTGSRPSTTRSCCTPATWRRCCRR